MSEIPANQTVADEQRQNGPYRFAAAGIATLLRVSWTDGQSGSVQGGRSRLLILS